MDELRIQLSNDSRNFKEIYFVNEYRSLYKFLSSKKVTWVFLIGCVLLICIYFLSFENPQLSWILVLGLLILFPSVVYITWLIVKYQNWKRILQKYFKTIDGYKKSEIIITENAIELIIDTDCTIEKWESFSTILINPDYILLEKAGKDFLLFPAKSMQSDQFLRFTEIAKARIK